jgi:hypothetical protein
MGSRTHELFALATELVTSSARVETAATAAVHESAARVVDEARSIVSGHPHLQQYPDSITFDVDVNGGSIAAEIGPDKDLPQGALGNLIEYGSANNAPIEHLNGPVEHEAQHLEEELGTIGARAVFR